MLDVIERQDISHHSFLGRKPAFTFGLGLCTLAASGRIRRRVPPVDAGTQKRSETMKHMGQDERNRIEFMLGCGNNVAAIAKALGRSESTISRELLNRRIDSDKHYGCSNRLCARFDDCARTAFNGVRDIRRRNSPGCFESCPDFREAVCFLYHLTH